MILMQRCWVCGALAEYEEVPCIGWTVVGRCAETWPGGLETLYTCREHHG